MKKFLLLSFLFTGIVGIGSNANGLDEESASPELISSSSDIISEKIQPDEIEESLHDRFVSGILKSRSVKNKTTGERKPYWFECGKRVPDEERENRASEWASSILSAVDLAYEEFGVRLNPWGVFATTHKEGGFDMCALDRKSRIYGWHVGAVKKYKMSYSKKEIRRIVVKVKQISKRWRFDAGPLQVRRSAEKTLEHLDDILSLDPGMQKGVNEMANRAVLFPKTRGSKRYPHPRPWMLWPTTNADSTVSRKYDRDIRGIARFLGARVDEI